MILRDMNLRILIIIMAVSLGPLIMGYSLSYSSSSTISLQAIHKYNNDILSWFASILNIGGIIGSIIIGLILDKYGRRKALLITFIPSIIGWLLIYVNPTLDSPRLILIGRTLCGIFCGMNVVASGVYFIEISPTAWRGRIGSLNQLGIVTGILMSYVTGTFMNYYKCAMYALIVQFIAFATLIKLMPESPRWLMMRKERSAALMALSELRPKNANLEAELSELECNLSNSDTVSKMSFLHLFSSTYKRQTSLSLGLMALQQLCGINAIMFFAESIFVMAGFKPGGSAAYCSVILGVVQLLATGYMVSKVDQFDRTFLLKLSGGMMCVSLFILAFYYNSDSKMASIAVLSLLLFIVGFSFGWGPLPVVITTEIFGLNARSKATSLAIITNWVFSFLVTQSFLTMQSKFSPEVSFIVFGVFTIIGLWFVRTFIPETRGSSLEDLENMWNRKPTTINA